MLLVHVYGQWMQSDVVLAEHPIRIGYCHAALHELVPGRLTCTYTSALCKPQAT